MTDSQLVQALAESFLALSNEVQSLIDRKTILEHKLRYAHEQYQYLADKYAPAVPEVSETLAKLQLPPDLHPLAAATSAVPLPKRGLPGSNQHQVALLIREGRKAAQHLVAAVASADADEGRWEDKELSTSPGMEVLTSVSTVLEKDFTVQGRKGLLACPFSAKPNQNGGPSGSTAQVDGSQDPAGAPDPAPPKPSDPICAAMLDETAAPAAAALSKCPIRYLDKHSPEEIAHYVETHKHSLPRSHEVCVRRYQRNEEQIRKLDAKYGSLVNMVEDLSHLHRPMMPPSKEELMAADRSSNKRVVDWTQSVEAGNPDVGDKPPVDDERDGRFDRPMRDVRVGESPSRPWGISVPLEAGQRQREPSLPRPVQEPAAERPPAQASKEPAARKCPFDHPKMFPGAAPPKREDVAEAPVKQPAATPRTMEPPSSTPQPTFINLPDTPAQAGDKGDRPQIVFNISGPVFIGYPMEQAIEFMKQLQGR
ncbi:hypothetical protein C8A05DRAFT_18612 [Staphylotrichum tortipilum]|uniref:Uncharacterized protein n=1 Tax=Staphylotrichum tortipilum TaxID=2831512 RepID=A0AAN6MF87_9PEZI|nr:hypothetical protein C8A05DRAFT_18612 [Staphylotrichum longicolle]